MWHVLSVAPEWGEAWRSSVLICGNTQFQRIRHQASGIRPDWVHEARAICSNWSGAERMCSSCCFSPTSVFPSHFRANSQKRWCNIYSQFFFVVLMFWMVDHQQNKGANWTHNTRSHVDLRRWSARWCSPRPLLSMLSVTDSWPVIGHLTPP